jgi:hypothetical protein
MREWRRMVKFSVLAAVATALALAAPAAAAPRDPDGKSLVVGERSAVTVGSQTLSSSGPEYTFRLVIRRVEDGPLPVERVR